MKKQVLLALTFSLLPSIVSCGESKKSQSLYFEEDLTSTNFLNDNYRNYYEIYVGSFYDSNNDGYGDLNGVTTKLDYIKDSGYNGIWLMPIFKSPTYHKYDALNYFEIDPSYGTMKDLDNLITECDKRDIKLILDMVLNHCSINNPIFIDSANAFQKELNHQHLSDEENKIKDMFNFSLESGEIRGLHFRNVPGHNFFVEENFQGGNMPEFNLDSEATRTYFKSIFDFYLEKGIDGFRIDAVSYLYKNQISKNVEFLNWMSSYLKSKDPNFYIVGECWESNNILERYYSSNIDSLFHFQGSTSYSDNYMRYGMNRDGALKSLYLDGLKAQERISKNHIPAIFLDNHDMDRVAITSETITKMFYGLASLHSGSLFTYYGDEIGMNGENPPDENIRTYMNWSDSNLTGRCNNPSGTKNFQGYIHHPLDIQIDDPKSIYNYYKKANLIRNQQPILTHGIITNSISEDDSSLLIIDKKYNDDSLTIVINFHSKESKILDNTLKKEVVGQLVIDPEIKIKNLGNNQIEIPPYGILIMK